jgi:transcriptional regulator with XRE-family HTH domain
MLMKNYNDIIRELREDNDLTQAQIANVLGTSQQIYSRYELGIRELPIKHLIRLCKYYNVSADYILCLKKNRK